LDNSLPEGKVYEAPPILNHDLMKKCRVKLGITDKNALTF
jgi:hypothetical protein